MSLTRQLAAATAQIDLVANIGDADRSSRANALVALSRLIDEHVRRLMNVEVQTKALLNAGLNPVSQREGD